MTIKEVEARTGMSRANIRFYEVEGFISPVRGDNGYRDYTLEDIQALLRIKLLRLLRFSLEEIKAVHNGEKNLPEALKTHLWELEGEQQQLDRAKQVSRTLLEDGADYAVLDARPYLTCFETVSVPGLKEDVLPRIKVPWRRYFARCLDTSLFALIWNVAVRFLEDSFFMTESGLLELLNIFIPVALTLLFEPLLLSTWGTTPGKWIMGLYVTDMEDQKLTRKEALERTWKVMWYGLGFGIPIYNTIRAWISLSKCESGKEQPWEEHSVLHLKDKKWWRTVGMIGAYAALIAILLGIRLFQPYDTLTYKGDLNVYQVIQNYNDIAEKEGYSYRLTRDGSWVWAPEDMDVYELRDEREMPAPEFITDEQGVVTGITWRWTVDAAVTEDMTEEELLEVYRLVRDVPDYHTEMLYLARAFACARTEGGSRSEEWDTLEELLTEDNRYLPFELQVGDVTVTVRVEYDGYVRRFTSKILSPYGEYNLVDASDARDYHCELEVTMIID